VSLSLISKIIRIQILAKTHTKVGVQTSFGRSKKIVLMTGGNQIELIYIKTNKLPHTRVYLLYKVLRLLFSPSIYSSLLFCFFFSVVAKCFLYKQVKIDKRTSRRTREWPRPHFRLVFVYRSRVNGCRTPVSPLPLKKNKKKTMTAIPPTIYHMAIRSARRSQTSDRVVHFGPFIIFCCRFQNVFVQSVIFRTLIPYT